MKHITAQLRELIATYAKRFSEIPDDIFVAKPLRHRWSKQEVLGHLLDSAQNNLRRFICSQYEPQPPLIVYQQDFWVTTNQYQNMEKADLIELWRLMNLRICAVLENMPEDNYRKQCYTGTLHTMDSLAEDYVNHMKHHINQIIAGSFDVIYV